MRSTWLALLGTVLFFGIALAAPTPTYQQSHRNDAPVVLYKAISAGEMPASTAKVSRNGAVKIRNKTYSFYIDVWVTLDAADVDWYYLGTVPPRQWRKWKLPKGPVPYYLVGVDLGGDPNSPVWGPSQNFWLGRKFTWTLLP